MWKEKPTQVSTEISYWEHQDLKKNLEKLTLEISQLRKENVELKAQWEIASREVDLKNLKYPWTLESAKIELTETKAKLKRLEQDAEHLLDKERARIYKEELSSIKGLAEKLIAASR